MTTFFKDDFGSFPVGPLPSSYFAIREYHYLPSSGFMGEWYEATISHTWRPCTAAWMIVEQDSKKRLLSTLESTVPYNRILVAGNPLWSDYSVSLQLQPLQCDGMAGIVFRYQNNREYYSLVLAQGKRICLSRICHEKTNLLYEQDYSYDNIAPHTLEAAVAGSSIFVGIDGNIIFSGTDDLFTTGRTGIISTTTCYFDKFIVSGEEKTWQAFVWTRDKKQRELDRLREQYPAPEVWKTIPTKGFGTGRQIRFGHLQGNSNSCDILLAQNLKLQPENDSYSTIRSLTAIDLKGNILWQTGEPADTMDAAMTTSDLPVQIYDIDDDGFDEVICVKNFSLMILDGKTGKVKNKTMLPNDVADENRFGYLHGDAVIIANVRGRPKPQDIIVKNRYRQFWVYDNNLDLLWTARRPGGTYPPNTGHFPVPCVINDDSRDGIFCGYTLFDADGHVLWNHDWPDHTDEIIIGRFDPAHAGLQIATASGNEGFCIFDAASGRVLHKDLLGHAQRISAAKFRSDLSGVQFYCVTYWHYPGIISFHDCSGKKLFSFEPPSLGNILNPVNWRGDGEELALLNTNVTDGGMIDGYGRKVVVFPDDGHPDLCCEVIDVAGDARSEIITWDTQSLWIYTQDRPAETPVYNPVRPPHWNNSNYRGEYSFPGDGNDR
ncbi:MAG: hypothetical protein JW904_06450 [Spirochaetales bacterium]|nr:hypothetical protein [Spirochaetales bacterium]